MMRGVCAAVFISLLAVSAAAQSVDVFVNKTAPASAAAGATITYVVTVGNNGPNSASSVTLSDALPAGVTFVSYTQPVGPAFTCSTPASGANGTINCSIATLASGAGAEFDIAVHLDAGLASGTVVTNTAAATTSSSDTNPNNDSAMASTTISAESDMFVFKNAPATATTGSNITFTVTAGNAGPNDAPNAHFNDVLPADVGFVSINQTTGPTFTCTTPAAGASGTVICTIATLAAGTSAQFDIVVTVDPQAAGTTLINTVTIASDNPDNNGENNTSVSGTSVAGGDLADLRILKTGPVSQPADTDVSYTITLTNDGPNDAAGVSWTDTLPNSIPPSSPLTFVGFNQTGGPTFSCSPGATTTCSIQTFPAGSTATFTLVAHIPPGTPSGDTYTNVVKVTSENDPNPDNDTSSTTVTISSADVGVLKSGPTTAIAGGPAYTYVVTLSNGGPDPATDVSFSDPLPAGLTFVGVVQNTGPAATCNGGQLVSCTISLLPNGQSAQFTITVQPQPTIPNGTVLTNTATASTSSADTNPNNDSFSVNTTVSANADLSIGKSGPATVVAGTNMTYTVTVTNNGPSTASNVNWSDTLPANTTFVSESQTTGPTFTCTAGATISCSIAALAPSATATFSVTVQVALSAPNASTISNTATVTSSTPDSGSGNNSSTVNTIVNANADLGIVKSGPLLAVAGSNITYTITVSNGGPAAAVNAKWNDLLPPATTFVSLSQTSGPIFTCTTGQSVSCDIATFASGASAAFNLVVQIAPGTANNTVINNTAGVLSPSSPDPNGTNNTSSVNTTVATSADLSVVKTAPAAAQAGANVTYTITAANAGPSDAATATLSDVLPAGTTFVSESQTSGPIFTCTTGPTVTCTIASFASGATASFNITVALGGSITNGTTVTNTATIASATPDPNLGNNTASAPTLVSANADLSVTKSGPTTTPSNTTIVYTVTAANAGPANALNVSLTETVPAGMTFVSVNQTSGPAFACSGTGPIVCTIATLSAGANATFQFTFNVPLSLAPGTTSSDTATITSSTPDGNPANNTASATTTVGQSIPALSPLAMALLAMALAMIGWVTARR
jgi:uncharacterized repeat protein (TIGR01451 family)